MSGVSISELVTLQIMYYIRGAIYVCDPNMISLTIGRIILGLNMAVPGTIKFWI
jgi:hypothetical protein